MSRQRDTHDVKARLSERASAMAKALEAARQAISPTFTWRLEIGTETLKKAAAELHQRVWDRWRQLQTADREKRASSARGGRGRATDENTLELWRAEYKRLKEHNPYLSEREIAKRIAAIHGGSANTIRTRMNEMDR